MAVEDATNFSSQPRGKQQINASGILYTSKWNMANSIEAVSPEAYLKQVKTTTNIDKSTVSLIPMTNVSLVNRYKVAIDVLTKKK